jgi:hypothetical protein
VAKKKGKPKTPKAPGSSGGSTGKDVITGATSTDNQYYAELSGTKAFSDTVYRKGSNITRAYENSFSNAFDMPQLSVAYELGDHAFSMLISKEQVQKDDPNNYWHAVTKTVYLGEFKYDGKKFTGGIVKYSGSQTYFFSDATQKLMNATSNPSIGGVKNYTGTLYEVNSQMQPLNQANAKGTIVEDYQGIWNEQFSSYFPANWWQDLANSFISAPTA